MAFGYRSSGRYNSRSGYRGSRGNRGSSFRGRGGRGSDSYFNSSRDSYSDRPPHRGSSYRENFRVKDESYDSRCGGSRYHNDRYSSSRDRRDDDIGMNRRDIRESVSGSFARDHVRRNDGEPDRKRMRSEIGNSYKEGASHRKSFDELDHSGRSFNSNNSSPYRSDSSPFGKSHRKEFSDFKKPLPPDHSFNGRRVARGSRGRGSTSRSGLSRSIKPSLPPFVKRSSVSQISRLKAASRLQQALRRKKQLRITRMRREARMRILASGGSKDKLTENDVLSSDPELDVDEEMETDDMEKEIELDEDVKPEIMDGVVVNKEPKKVVKVKKEGSISAESESSKIKEKEKLIPVKGLRRDYIKLKCIHCKVEYKTFKLYQHHLASYKHKLAMENLLHDMKQKLRRMRTEQREQQRIIDEQSDDFSKTSYCKLCKLNYKQTKQEHYTSDFHINMNEFLNSRCKVCRISFGTPILYEHHRCTLTHIKRKSFLEKKGIAIKDGSNDDDNNDEESFMVLDSVGSADESNDDAELSVETSDSISENKSPVVTKKKITKVIGGEFIKKVSAYYCKLCRLCLSYNPNRNLEDSLLAHCRGRFHLKRFSLEKLKNTRAADKDSANKTGANAEKLHDENDDNTSLVNTESETDDNEKSWINETIVDDHKSSEDEDDSQSGNRYDRFGTSDEKDNIEKQKTEFENAENTPPIEENEIKPNVTAAEN